MNYDGNMSQITKDVIIINEHKQLYILEEQRCLRVSF